MKQLTKYSKMIVCMVLTLILCVGATLGITLTFFGDTKSGSATITLGSSIYFAESGGVGVAVQNGETPIVPSQSVNIQTTLKVMSGSDTNVTKGVLKVIPSLSDAIEGASLTLAANSTYDVFFGTSTTASTDAEMVVHDNALYLVKQSNNSELYEITPSTSGLVIKFSVPVTFSSNISNDMGGKSCVIEMKGIVVQSLIYNDTNSAVLATISNFQPYFTQTLADYMSYNVTLNEGYVDIGENNNTQITILYYAVDGSNEVLTYNEGDVINVKQKIWVSTSNNTPNWTATADKIMVEISNGQHFAPDVGSSYYCGLCVNETCIDMVESGCYVMSHDIVSAIVTITEDCGIAFAIGLFYEKP